jgi:hypothetical protein
MCLQCDGYSFEDVMRATDLDIRTHGWHHVLVEDDKPWSYTIGLRESYHHPELVVVDLDRPSQIELVQWACRSIEECGSIDDIEARFLGIEIATVHDVHLASNEWFGSWHSFYGEQPPSGSFLQLFPPPSWECACHRGASRRLDRADGRPAGNRAQRRADMRAKRGRAR